MSRRTQYAVTYFPHGDQSMDRAVGPFFSEEKAEKVRDAINAADADMADDWHAAAAPQVVELVTLAEALEDLR